MRVQFIFCFASIREIAQKETCERNNQKVIFRVGASETLPELDFEHNDKTHCRSGLFSIHGMNRLAHRKRGEIILTTAPKTSPIVLLTFNVTRALLSGTTSDLPSIGPINIFYKCPGSRHCSLFASYRVWGFTVRPNPHYFKERHA